MFGPNGAGKSAVFDSLELLKLIFSKEWGYKSSNLISLLERWASHSSDPKSIAVGIQFEMDKNWQLSAQAANLRNLNRIHLPSLEAGDYLEDFQGQNFNFFIKFSKRIDWIIEEFKRVGLDTARSVLRSSMEDLMRRTELEEETIAEVKKILQSEFED
jgi:hypothetical protein